MTISRFENFIFSASRRPIANFKRSKRGEIKFTIHLQTPFFAFLVPFLKYLKNPLVWDPCHCVMKNQKFAHFPPPPLRNLILLHSYSFKKKIERRKYSYENNLHICKAIKIWKHFSLDKKIGVNFTYSEKIS